MTRNLRYSTMKIGIVSDTHGFYQAWLRAYDLYLSKTNLILHAGDILYCSPGFNPLTEDFNPKKLADHINSINVPIIFCQGDNDSDVDQKKLNFPILSHFAHLYIEGISILMHHGEMPKGNFVYKNRLTPDEMFLYSKKMNADIFIMGRTHNPLFEKIDGLVHINPGSPVATVHDNKDPSVAILDTDLRQVDFFVCYRSKQSIKFT
ncbi:Protein of unknown function UPF0025 [Beggiatoa sp. PS]|nr:Protein of unknown function UPF0025 [Beggiatoa sp. PS]